MAVQREIERWNQRGADRRAKQQQEISQRQQEREQEKQRLAAEVARLEAEIQASKGMLESLKMLPVQDAIARLKEFDELTKNNKTSSPEETAKCPAGMDFDGTQCKGGKDVALWQKIRNQSGIPEVGPSSCVEAPGMSCSGAPPLQSVDPPTPETVAYYAEVRNFQKSVEKSLKDLATQGVEINRKYESGEITEQEHKAQITKAETEWIAISEIKEEVELEIEKLKKTFSGRKLPEDFELSDELDGEQAPNTGAIASSELN